MDLNLHHEHSIDKAYVPPEVDTLTQEETIDGEIVEAISNLPPVCRE